MPMMYNVSCVCVPMKLLISHEDECTPTRVTTVYIIHRYILYNALWDKSDFRVNSKGKGHGEIKCLLALEGRRYMYARRQGLASSSELSVMSIVSSFVIFCFGHIR